MADYATIEQVQAFADEPDSTGSDAWSLLVSSASRLFDRLVGVADGFFQEVGASATARTFYGDGTAYLQLDPFVSTPAPTVTIPGAEYTVEDGSFVVKDGMLVFLDKTRRMSDAEFLSYDRYAGWRDAIAVSVTAKWGFDAIPSDVTYAVSILAVWMWRQRDASVAVTADLPNLQNQPIPTAAKEVVDRYAGIYSRTAVFA